MVGLGLLTVAIQDAGPFTPAVAGNDGRTILWVAMGVGILALAAAGLLARAVIGMDTGTPAMRAISDAIREGAEAFLRRQYRTIGIIAVGLAFIVYAGYNLLLPEPSSASSSARSVRPSPDTPACTSPSAPTSAPRLLPAPA